jgi:hypothetical protein
LYTLKSRKYVVPAFTVSLKEKAVRLPKALSGDVQDEALAPPPMVRPDPLLTAVPEPVPQASVPQLSVPHIPEIVTTPVTSAVIASW